MWRVLIVMTFAAAGTLLGGNDATSQPSKELSVLVFSKTAGYRHESIPAGIAAIRMLGQQHGFKVLSTENASLFADSKLNDVQVVVFLNTSGDVLDHQQQSALERFIKRGGGFVGVHAAADTEHDWPWYRTLVGARFKSHPEVQAAVVIVNDRTHPSTKRLPDRWVRTDEWYNFDADPREALGDTIRALASVDESSYTGGSMGATHPVAWCREYERGRAWYTAMGHTTESYSEPEFLAHLLGGIQWAGKRTE